MGNRLASSCFTSLQRLPSIVGRQSVTQDMEFFVLIEGDFENLIDQIAVGRELVQGSMSKYGRSGVVRGVGGG